MKLATLKNNNRDGQLVVVSKNLSKAVLVQNIAPTLQAAIDNWQTTETQLQEVYQALNQKKITQDFDFQPRDVCAPLPRAYQWLDGSAYVNHVELVRKARGATMPESFWTDPLMYQGGSDTFLAPNEVIPLADEAWGLDFEAEIAVITNDVPMGTTPERAPEHIILLMLSNDVSLRNLIPSELAKGFGFFQSKPSSSFSPVAVTPDELASAWSDSKVHLPIQSTLNGQLFGAPNAGVDMTFSFADLIAHATKTRKLAAGTIIGSGTVSNCNRTTGSSCIAEKRMLEILEKGSPQTPFMSVGDSIRIEMFNTQQESIFGAIEQKIVQFES